MFQHNSHRENRAIYEIMRKKYGSARQVADNIIRRMCSACSITKNTDTNPEYVIFFILPLKLWLGERVLLLCYNNIAYIVYSVAVGLGYLCLSVELWPFPAWLRTECV